MILKIKNYYKKNMYEKCIKKFDMNFFKESGYIIEITDEIMKLLSYAKNCWK